MEEYERMKRTEWIDKYRNEWKTLPVLHMGATLTKEEFENGMHLVSLL